MHSFVESWVHEATAQFGEVVSVASSNAEAILASPVDTEQVSKILAFANDRHLSVVPVGGGTKQQWGRGAAPHIYLSLARLDRVIEHPWQDLTCTVQAGCVWSKLQQVLAVHGQFVALDPVFPDRATVGGIIASNDSGALRLRFGGLRDLVIGMTLVLADGTIAKTGGKVVKNVAGYDLAKLLTGSLGTLAVITEVNFRLHSLPHYLRRFSVSAPQASRFSSLLAAIRASHLLVQALQITRRSGISRMSIVLDAHPAAHQEELLSRIVADEGLNMEEMPASSGMERDALFHADGTVLKIATMPAQVCETADLLQQISPIVEIESVSQAHGLHTVAMRGPSAGVMEAIHRIRSGMLHPESTMSVLQMAPGVDVKTFEIPVPALNVMQAIKQQFDPENTLGPGKFF
jgi:glycolate oxidase FAD binding subunit